MSRYPSIELLLRAIRGRLLVSCQATTGDIFDDAESMKRFALAAMEGGAAGIRANGPRDIRAIRAVVSAPIVGIDKRVAPDGRILITPDFSGAQALAAAGADVIALDCTKRGQEYGALERLRAISQELGVLIAADIATEAEAIAAAKAGAHLVLSTMRGYTDDTAHLEKFDADFIARLVRAVEVPVIAEGRINSPQEARSALEAGTDAVIVGTAITRPATITRWFAEALDPVKKAEPSTHVVAIDMGGTNTKSGIVSSDGLITAQATEPTPFDSRDVILEHLKRTVHARLRDAQDHGLHVSAIGVATTGWVDGDSGAIAFATEVVPDWTGAPVRDVLQHEFRLPTFVENDANALAHAEFQFGAARGLRDFLCITLGTGVGGGYYANGRLVRGAHSIGGAIGHISIRPDGLRCACGQTGCLEMYASAAALLRTAADPQLDSVEKVIAAANAGQPAARNAIRECAEALAEACTPVIHLLDPQLIVLAGGVAQGNTLLAEDLAAALQAKVMYPERRRLSVKLSGLGYHAGVLGAATLALRPGTTAG